MTTLGQMLPSDELTTSQDAIPVGVVLPWPGDGGSAPTGWLYCRGQLVSTGGANAALFAVMGHKYNGGADPGGSQFRLPDLREVWPRGSTASGDDFTDPGGPTGGGSYSDGAWSHSHARGGLTATEPGHTQGYVAASHTHTHNLSFVHHHDIGTSNEKVQGGTATSVGTDSRCVDVTQAVAGTVDGPTTTLNLTGSFGAQGLTLGGTLAAGQGMPFLTMNYVVKL